MLVLVDRMHVLLVLVDRTRALRSLEGPMHGPLALVIHMCDPLLPIASLLVQLPYVAVMEPAVEAVLVRVSLEMGKSFSGKAAWSLLRTVWAAVLLKPMTVGPYVAKAKLCEDKAKFFVEKVNPLAVKSVLVKVMLYVAKVNPLLEMVMLYAEKVTLVVEREKPCVDKAQFSMEAKA